MRRHVYRARAEDPPEGPTLLACIAVVCNEINARARAAGRTEWDDADNALAVKLLARHMRRLPDPYTEIANRMEAKQSP